MSTLKKERKNIDHLHLAVEENSDVITSTGYQIFILDRTPIGSSTIEASLNFAIID